MPGLRLPLLHRSLHVLSIGRRPAALDSEHEDIKQSSFDALLCSR